MTGRTFDGRPLTPGKNVDKVNLAKGCEMASRLGYIRDGNESMVVTYALQRWARGEEDGAERTWMGHFGNHSYSDWRVVLAAAVS